MIKVYINIIVAVVVAMVLSACGSTDDLAIDNTPPTVSEEPWEEKDMEGASVTIKPFIAGDDVTRSTYVFDSQKLVFGWQGGDRIGIYPTAKMRIDGDTDDGLLDPKDEANRHPQYNALTNNVWRVNPIYSGQRIFGVSASSSQTAQIFNNDPDFVWDEIVKWTAYFPYRNNNESYDVRRFSFKNQVQKGLVDISSYRLGTSGTGGAGAGNTSYKESEARACAHLAEKDVLISPEMSWSGERVNFQLRHLGAIARLYLLAPKDNGYVITSVKLICENPIFYTDGTYTMKSHPYNASGDNYGVDLDKKSPGYQITPDEDSKTNMVEVTFPDGSATTHYDPSNSYTRYITAYIMMMPVQYTPSTDGKLFAYVTAYKQGDPAKSEVRFVSSALAAKDLCSGFFYQWQSSTTNITIEMTATLQPWQDIVGAGINADLEN